MTKELIPYEMIQSRIFLIRGQKVMIDRDLAELYGVKTMVLNQAVKRNISRFPADFMIRLNEREKKELITICDRFDAMKHSPTSPYAFTEQGVAMLSSVLNSERAVQVNIQIMRTFTKLRKLLATHTDLRRKITELERKYDGQFKIVFEAIKEMMEMPDRTVKNVGFLKDR